MTLSDDSKPRGIAANVVVVHPDLEQRTRWANAISECNVWQASDSLAANSLAEDQDAQLIIAPWPWATQLLRKRRRLPARPLLLLGGEIDQTIVHAVAAGVDITHWPDDSGFEHKVRSLIVKAQSRSPRFNVDDVEVVWGEHRHRAKVSDLALDGFSFTLPLDASIEKCMPGSRLLHVELLRGSKVCVSSQSATVRYLSAEKNMYRVGCSFDRGSGHANLATGETSIRQALRIAGVIQAALKQSKLRLERPDHSLVLDCSGEIDVTRRLISVATTGPDRLSPLDVVRCSFEFGGELYQFSSAVVTSQPLELRMPTELTVKQRRASTRYEVQVPMKVSVTSHLTGHTHEGVVKDLSGTGCLIELPRDALYPRGSALHSMSISLPQGAVVLKGTVTHAARGEHHLRLGVEFNHDTEEALLLVAQFLVTQRWPTLESGASATFDELFDLFLRSGLVKVAHIEALRPGMEEVRRTFSLVSNIANTLFRSIVIRERGRVVGHVSSVRVYQNTWYVQHLAAASGSPESSLHVNLGVADFFDQLRGLEYFKMAFYSDNNYTGRAFATFARRIESPTLSMTRQHIPLLIRVERTPPPPPLPKGIDSFEAGRDDYKTLQHFMVQRTPSLMLKSDDLLAEHFGLAQLDEDFLKYSMHRRRRAWVLRDANGILAVALAELTSPGLSLFDYLNNIRILYAHSNPEFSKERIIDHFIATILPFFADRKAPAVRLFIEVNEMADYEKLGFAPARVVTEWICHRRANRQLAEHIYGLGEALRERSKRVGDVVRSSESLLNVEPAGHDLSISSVNLPKPSILKIRSGD